MEVLKLFPVWGLVYLISFQVIYSSTSLTSIPQGLGI